MNLTRKPTVSTVQINFRAARPLRDAFDAACAADGRSPSSALRYLMRLYIEDVAAARAEPAPTPVSGE